jgi:hypothetical protein
LAAQQQADPNFDATVKRPAYTTSHPRVAIDEAHFNFHTASGRYKPFADLVRNDGYVVTPNTAAFTPDMLKAIDVLVISNAGVMRPTPAERLKSAFTDAECDVVADWVRSGGALLLVADHSPAGAAAAGLSERFSVTMSKGFTTDPTRGMSDNKTWIRFSRSNGGLSEHPITRGRDGKEFIANVLSFTGQSLLAPPNATVLLRLSDQAYDTDGTDNSPRTPASGRGQAVVLPFGQGRAAVFGEAAMLTAQNENFGMNYRGTDDKQFVLNVMHRLSRLLN